MAKTAKTAKTTKKQTSGWVLYSMSSGYFERITGVGPACTPKLGEAHVFDTKNEALDHLAYRFTLVIFAPYEVDAVWV